MEEQNPSPKQSNFSPQQKKPRFIYNNNNVPMNKTVNLAAPNPATQKIPYYQRAKPKEEKKEVDPLKSLFLVVGNLKDKIAFTILQLKTFFFSQFFFGTLFFRRQKCR